MVWDEIALIWRHGDVINWCVCNKWNFSSWSTSYFSIIHSQNVGSLCRVRKHSNRYTTSREYHEYNHTRDKQNEGKYFSESQLHQITHAMDVSVYVSHSSLRRRHNENDGVSNHRWLDCLLSRLFRRNSKKNQSSEWLAFVRGIQWWPVVSLTKGL